MGIKPKKTFVGKNGLNSLWKRVVNGKIFYCIFRRKARGLGGLDKEGMTLYSEFSCHISQRGARPE